MGKHEAPPFRMIIERGRLVPATPYDAERLDTYRNGMEVRVRLTEDQDRVMIRKWWAILGRAVKECKTPWKTKEQASEAIKLAIGVVKYGKTVGGEFMTYPKSLTELDDPELTAAVEQMIDVIYGVTGVDPAEWRKGVAHIQESEPSSPHHPAPEDAAAGVSPAPAATDTRAAGLEAGGEAADGQSAPPASETKLTDDDRAFLVRVWHGLKAAVGPDVDVLKRQALIFKGEIAGKSSLVKAKATKIRTELEKCCGEEPATGTVSVSKYVAGLIGVEERELA